MKIDIICVGKLKENYFKDAVSEYLKRLSKYGNFNIIEVADEKTPDKASEKEEKIIKQKEGERILKSVNDASYVIALDLKGKELDSVELSLKISELGIKGISHIQFIIGGSLGLSDEVIKRADYSLCFSKMTFPHQLMRVILLEQIYRSYRIINNEPYHK